MEKEEIFKKTNKKKITNSFKYAFCGIITGIKNEKNMKICCSFVAVHMLK